MNCTEIFQRKFSDLVQKRNYSNSIRRFLGLKSSSNGLATRSCSVKQCLPIADYHTLNQWH